MAQKPFLALVIPAEAQARTKPDKPDKPDHPHGGPPGQQEPVFPTHPIVIEPPERPEAPELPAGSKVVLVWDGESWRWAVLDGDQISQLPTELPEPK